MEKKVIQLSFYGMEEITVLREAQKHCIDIDKSFNDYVKDLIKADFHGRGGAARPVIQPKIKPVTKEITPNEDLRPDIIPDQKYSYKEIAELVGIDKSNITRKLKSVSVQPEIIDRIGYLTGNQIKEIFKKQLNKTDKRI